MSEMLVKLGVDWKTFIAQLINFLVLFLALWYFAWGPIAKALEDRRKTIEKGITDADEASKKLDEIAKERDEVINDARAHALSVVDAAKKQAAEIRTAKFNELEEELTKKKQEAKEQIETERRETYNSLRNDIAKLVTEATGKLVSGLDEKAQNNLVEAAIKEVENA